MVYIFHILDEIYTKIVDILTPNHLLIIIAIKSLENLNPGAALKSHKE